MARVLFRSPFIPPEWIAGHGFTPARFTPGTDHPSGDPGRSREGVCPFLSRFHEGLAAEPDVSAVLFTTVCDQERRARERPHFCLEVPSFLMHVPKTWKTQTARRLYRDELERLSGFLAALGGSRPDGDSLCRIMKKFDESRSHLRSMKPAIPPRALARAVQEFHRSGEWSVPRCDNDATGTDRIPVGLIGGPLPSPFFDLFDIIERHGGRVVLDATETGERTFPRPFEPGLLESDPVSELADAYFGSIPDAFRRPNTLLYTWLAERLDSHRIRGMILIRHVWCDIWHAESASLREFLDVPVIDVEIDGAPSMIRTETRLQAFLEMLR